MNRNRVTVQHFVACIEARVVPPVGPHNFYDLLGVGYKHMVPPDAEPPWEIDLLDHFVRFVSGVGKAEFEIELVWLDAPEGRRRIDFFGPYTVAFRPTDQIRDTMFRIRRVPLDGAGRYRFRLWQIQPRRRRLGTEFIHVSRSP